MPLELPVPGRPSKARLQRPHCHPRKHHSNFCSEDMKKDTVTGPCHCSALSVKDSNAKQAHGWTLWRVRDRGHQARLHTYP